MTRTWLSVTVELLGGRGEELWPYPGRVFAVGPRHAFRELAEAINDAFARWDRAHLSVFTLADGRVITDADAGTEIPSSTAGPAVEALDIETTEVGWTLDLGEEFQFTFDLGDEWIHRCEVAISKIDPEEHLGMVPTGPLPYWGWGSIPDQYGRNWSGDDGESRAPLRPNHPHPMLLHTWPNQEQVPELDMVAVYDGLREDGIDGFLAAVTDRDVDDTLQLLGSELPPLLLRARDRVAPLALSIAERLRIRGWEGDDVLSEDLLAHLRRQPLEGRVVPVDLDMFSSDLEGDPNMSRGGFLDLETGFSYGGNYLDDMGDDDEYGIDVDADPDRYLQFDCLGSRAGWQDMAIFTERQRDPQLRERLERAIEGRGAFRRFRDVVYNDAVGEQWNVFSRERQTGRARAYLAAEGIRVGDPPEGARRRRPPDSR